jgi:hypothetical protein
MKDWSEFAKTAQATAESVGTAPSAWQYIIIKATDNFLAISVFILTLIFAYVGLFTFTDIESDKASWSLNAANLCLGVFLGLLKKS